jgi:RND family efflux transporter MFP subunit
MSIRTSRWALPAISASLLLVACSPHTPPTDARTQAPLVEVMTVQVSTENSRRFTGTVAARVQSSLGFRVGGKITERLIEVGQRVRRNQPLMRLDSSDLALGVSAQNSSVDAARAKSARADADLARMDGLVAQGAISAKDFDAASEAARGAKAQLRAAEAQAGLAKNADGYTLLLADSDGIVVSTEADVGQVVSSGQPVVILAKDGPREADVSLPETVRPTIGSEAQAQLFGPGQAAYPAKLRELSHSADRATRTFAARYVLSGDAANAPLGSTVSISFGQKAQEGEMRVPVGALHERGKGFGVWVLGADNKVTLRPITVASVGEEAVTVSEGLKAGEKIVALGAHLLNENEAVRVVQK